MTSETGVRGSQCVILLHGLGRTKRSMAPMQRFLDSEGFATLNLGYRSTQFSIERLADGLRPKIEEAASGFKVLHFVTHSMGGILLRYLLAEKSIPNLGRCVMLGPPNQGSQVVDRLRGTGVFGWINGPAGLQLGTGEGSVPCALGPVDFELGVLAGNRSINLILSLLIPGPNDGKVAVTHAKVAGQRDFKVMPVSHPFFMVNREVQRNTLAFLRDGAFLAD